MTDCRVRSHETEGGEYIAYIEGAYTTDYVVLARGKDRNKVLEQAISMLNRFTRTLMKRHKV
jgi:hypothetical protein